MENFLSFDRWMEMLGFAVGLLYLYWEYHGNARMWIAGLVMPVISFWVYYKAGLYADFAMNCYYFVMAVYGYAVWTRSERQAKGASVRTEIKNAPRKGKGKGRPISRMTWPAAGIAAAIFCVSYALLAWWLVGYTDSTVPWWDAFTTAGSITATWMLARKYLAQWIVWMAVDAVCTGLYFYKDRPFYGILYALYTGIAVAGYFKWRRMLDADRKPEI